MFGAVLLFPRGEKLWAFSLGRMRGPAPGPGPRLGLASEQPRSERFTSGGRIGVGALAKPLIKSTSPRALSPFRRGSSFDIEKFNALDLNDPKVPTLDELDDKAKSLENSALDNKEIINSEGAEVAWSRTKYLLAASNGLFQEFSKTNSSFILAVLAGNKNCMEREYEYKTKIYLEELGDFEKVGRLTADRAIKRLNAKKII